MDKKLLLRIEDSLYNDIQVISKRERRSINNTITVMLINYLDSLEMVGVCPAVEISQSPVAPQEAIVEKELTESTPESSVAFKGAISKDSQLGEFAKGSK